MRWADPEPDMVPDFALGKCSSSVNRSGLAGKRYPFNQVKHAIPVFAGNGNIRHDKRSWQNRRKCIVQNVLHTIQIVPGDPACQGNMKPEIFHNIWIPPAVEVCFLLGRQTGLSSLFQLAMCRSRPERV